MNAFLISGYPTCAQGHYLEVSNRNVPGEFPLQTPPPGLRHNISSCAILGGGVLVLDRLRLIRGSPVPYRNATLPSDLFGIIPALVRPAPTLPSARTATIPLKVLPRLSVLASKQLHTVLVPVFCSIPSVSSSIVRGGSSRGVVFLSPDHRFKR